MPNNRPIISRLPINTKSSRNRTKARSSHCIIQHWRWTHTCGVARGVAWGGVVRRGRSLTSHHTCRAPLPTPVTPPLSR